ncbi:hypothetical protein RJ639_032819 [Escallonia herrerae]|uniref:DC1 domain-containing protein n=1 Tax=Escallonia herrerae TaxID=1293975 RepID=A0AA89BKI6_9ASTE|nr:hypothetical protein RJ639_032819 [Escallonia herrerae]
MEVELKVEVDAWYSINRRGRGTTSIIKTSGEKREESSEKEMETPHFSHEHPLTLDEVQKDDDGEVTCCGCLKTIVDSAYGCKKCGFFLHKTCAELPEKITHTMHPQHQLQLFARPVSSHKPDCPNSLFQTCDCNVCGLKSRGFTYRCSLCDFNVGVSCASDKTAMKLDFHEHPLTYVQRPASFRCDACLKEDKDVSYRCTGCPFWIHKSCAMLPKTKRSNDHVHPLVLAYSLPTEDCMFENYCDICSQSVHPSAWLYYCGDCKYYAHIVCAMSELSRSSWPTDQLILEKDSFPLFFLGEGSEVILEDFESDPVALPLRDGALGLISQLLKALGFEDDDREKECSHFSHRHPLLLADIQSTDEVLILCDGCVQPISGPSYSCRQCDFVLHSSCAKLPPKVKHPFHPEHPLDLKMARNSVAITECSGCRTFCNGLTYRCESCKFYLDVKCAILPRNIKHEAVGRLTSHLVKNGGWCSACQGSFSGIIYASELLRYQVSTVCAQLPHMVKHRYDEHPLKLTYSPIPDRPGEYVCEICEKYLNPKLWFYHCLECDYSFHVGCISPHPYMNIKFGSSYQVDRHPHSLTLLRESKNKTPSPCDLCGGPTASKPVLGCESCNFQLGLTCATKIIDSSSTNALQPLS